MTSIATPEAPYVPAPQPAAGPGGSVSWRTLSDGRIEVVGEGVPMPSAPYAKRLAATAARWLPLAREHAHRTGVPLSWILAIMDVESAGNPDAVSPAGAVGLMQLMPLWWHGRTQEQMMVPAANVAAGTDLLRILQTSTGIVGELPRVASVYNCGSDTGANAPRLRPGTRWGMCAEGTYIDQVVSENNYAIATWPEAMNAPASAYESAPAGLGPLPFIAVCASVLRWAGVKLW